MNKKLLSVVISAVMILASISITALAADNIEINEKNFPDSMFREHVKERFDRNKDGVLSMDEIAYVTHIDVSKPEPAEDGTQADPTNKNELIESLVGIEHFTNLTILYCQRTSIRELDLSKNTKLTHLNCSDTNIQVLDLKNNLELVAMSSYRARLKELDLTANTKLEDQAYFEDNKSVVDFEIDANTGKTICDFKKAFSDISRVTVNESPGWYVYDKVTGILTFKGASNTTIGYTYDTKYKNDENTSLMRAYLTRRADYSKVDEAIAKIPADMSKLYTEASIKAVVDAQKAVFTDKGIDQQGIVDGYAKVIETAIGKLEFKKADYSKVDEAITKIPENMNEMCSEESILVVTNAKNAVVRDKFISDQALVDGYANAIELAIAGLQYKDADYSKVDLALTKIPEDISAIYSEASVEALNNAKVAVIRGKKADEQNIVDGYASAIEAAIAGLELKKADYSKLNETIAKIPTNMELLFTENSIKAVNDAKNAVVEGKLLSEQEIVDGYVKAIEDAIAGLEYKKADYSKVDEAIAKIPADMSKLYTEDSIKAVNDAKNAILRDKEINEQDLVDGYASTLESAIAGLKKLEIKDEKPVDNKPVDNKPVDNKPVDNKPADNKPVDNNKPTENVKTADNSNLFIYVLLSLISMAGVATVIGTRRRKENN